MKKYLMILVAVMALCAGFSSCSKDDDSADTSDIVGTWDISEVYAGDQWIDISNAAFSKYQASITFRKDGTYYGTGYFGTGGGEYTYDGKTVRTYIDGEAYMIYRIKTLSKNACELTMSDANDKASLKIRAMKR